MKIAIHHVPGSFSDKWLEYCDTNKIPYKKVNCFKSDVISDLSDCDALMWHFHHANFTDSIAAKNILFSIEHSGKRVFPDFNTVWHFNDKLSQKYLFESLGINHADTFIFYSKREAYDWIDSYKFPVIFKLRGGASSYNVKLIKGEKQAKRLVKQAFGRGFNEFNKIEYFKERIRGYKNGYENYYSLLKGFYRLLFSSKFGRLNLGEKGSILFQEFIPGNTFDIRVIVIGDKAFAIKRMVRGNDFRASGSGNILYGKDNFSESLIEHSFKLNDKFKSQCIAYDYVFKGDKPVLVEISYAFKAQAYTQCEGYWDKNLDFHAGFITPEYWMIQDLIKSI